MDRTHPSIVHFYRLIEQARMPQRADRSAAGTLPTRAYRYCEAVTTATAFGWWIFPPTDLRFLWDGHDIFWQCDADDEWQVLQPAAQFPDFASHFDAAAPASLAGCAPPFLTALPEPGTLQIWTGLMARAADGWGMLLRAPANLPLPGGYVLYEGIIEADRWFGPLFINLRLTRSHSPVRLRPDFPMALLQPLPHIAYADATLDAVAHTTDLHGLETTDWDAYRTSVAGPNDNPDRAFGAYAVAARKRNRGTCPAASQATVQPLRA